ncbi:Hypothetical protein Minf_2038 [Methylacidiphilum infernorum V4]|uniref:Uncharacterized protein n=1 Tax=Methylacidiphilum infernorum (isolate V4) TaxID=481448 RepID=B3DZ00_METI4|nr:Hypothetical protein Minf_2038 [Methylacidiphilum infernorum V4]
MKFLSHPWSWPGSAERKAVFYADKSKGLYAMPMMKKAFGLGRLGEGGEEIFFVYFAVG